MAKNITLKIPVVVETKFCRKTGRLSCKIGEKEFTAASHGELESLVWANIVAGMARPQTALVQVGEQTRIIVQHGGPGYSTTETLAPCDRWKAQQGQGLRKLECVTYSSADILDEVATQVTHLHTIAVDTLSPVS